MPRATKPMKKRNAKRLAARRAVEFGPVAAAVRLLPCAVCGKPGPNDPHHMRSRGAGGKSDSLVSLRREHHTIFHTIGRDTFAARYDIDLEAERF